MAEDEVKKKVVYENRPIALDPMGVEESVVEPELPEQTIAPEVKEDVPTKEISPFGRSALIGATPLLFGILTGNAVEGAQVAGENLLAEDKIARDAQAKNAKGTLEQRLAALRLERELAKTATEREKQRTAKSGLLEDKHVIEVEGPDGKPIPMTNDEAVRLQAKVWKKPSDADGFHLEDKMKLEQFKAGLKGKDEKKMDEYQKAKSENELYRLYQKDSDTTKRMGDAYTRFKGTLSRPPSSANDLAVVFNFMKILDPGSTVREGEQASAANAASIPDAVRTMYNRLLLGKDKTLPDGLRERFFEEASAMYKEQLRSQSVIDNHYKGISSRRGFDSNNIVTQHPSLQEQKEVPKSLPKSAKLYSNGKEEFYLDTSKLTPRMKKDLATDGFKEQ